MDKSTLFQKMTPDRTLEIKQSTGGKHDKAWITINFTGNVIEFYKLEF